VPVPPPDEQRAIADFLDRETARLDRLVGKKRELIEKLKEKRTALISRTVTRGLPADAARAAGLNPHPKLKPSGIEWLGDIPEHWEVKPIKRGTRILRGKFTHRPRNDPRMYEGPYPFIQTGDVVFAKKFIRKYSQTLSEEGFGVSKMFPAGTLVMTIAANIGDVAILDFDACFPDSIVGLVPGNGVSLTFLFYLAVAMRPVLLRSATLNTQLNINNEQIGRIGVAFPPSDEQRAIADYLDHETAKLDQLIEKVEAAIEKLQEYRTALITAAVTGKIDVRGALADSEE
jgi:type I restriction enzyme S subunit